MRNIQLARLPWSDVPAIEDITDSLPKKGLWDAMVKRWTVKGVWDGVTYNKGPRDAKDITTIVVHHSGSPEGTIQSHANYHAGKWGAGIAYHIVIDKGRIYQTNNLLSMTYHAGNNNTYTVGICVNRDLSKNDLTELERKLLYAAILTVKSLLPITEIKGHRELPTAATACPATLEKRIREDVATLELKLAVTDTPNDNVVTAFAVKTRIDAIYNKAVTVNVNQPEATRKMKLMHEWMVKEGLL